MPKFVASSLLVFFVTMALSSPLVAQQQADQQRPRGPQEGWSTVFRGGAVTQFDTDLEEGGSYRATRFNIEAGQGYGWNRRNSVTLALSYSYDGYSFSSDNSSGIAALKPWEDIHSVNLSLPVRWGVNNDWSTFLIPSVRSSGESGANFSDTITGGILAGFAYRFGDTLTIGPGLGVISQLEENATVFPILIINWKITDKLSLETGRGLAATLGPGLTLNYKASERWSLLLGGRYEKLRFRLDEQGRVPNGIGEDSSIPLFAGATYAFNPKSSISLVGGVELAGELRQEDEEGNRISKETYDPTGFLGLTFNLRL